MKNTKIALPLILNILCLINPNVGALAQQSSNKFVSGPGIYLVAVTNGTEKLSLIEPSTYTKAVVSAHSIGNTSPASTRSRIIVEGEHAKINTSLTRPYFYFYFADGKSVSNDFILARMDAEASRRVLTGGQNNPFEPPAEEKKKKTDLGYVIYPRVNKMYPLEFEVASGAVRVTPINTLSAGDYCFFYRGSGSLSDLFNLRSRESAFCFNISESAITPSGGTRVVPERPLLHR
jgi:hypothetical protein